MAAAIRGLIAEYARFCFPFVWGSGPYRNSTVDGDVDYYVGTDLGCDVCFQKEKPMMKTIQMTIDETLLADVDRAVDEMGTNRSLFIRKALQSALRQHAIEKLEARHAAGYAEQPAGGEEVTEWVDEQVWGEA